MLNGAIIDVKKFLLNGKNYICDLLNTRDELIKTSIEINIPLPRGYYVFNKGYDSIEIMNLTTKQKVFFNYSVKKNQAIFSCFDGIESSTFACVNLIFQIELLPKEKKRLFFNLGEEKMSALSAKDMQKFFEMSQNLMNNVFDVKIASHNKAFDNDFNYKLPRLIWESWLNFDFDEKSENEWIKIRNGIVKNNSSGFEINDEYKNLKEVKIFDNDVWKRVFIVHNDCKYLFAGRTKYYNLTLITKEIFSKNNEFYLSFS